MSILKEDALNALKEYGKGGEIILDETLAKIVGYGNKDYRNNTFIGLTRQINQVLSQEENVETIPVVKNVMNVLSTKEGSHLIISSCFGYKMKK